MALGFDRNEDELDPRFEIFHELMQRKVRDVLLVSTLYDACIMDEDGRLTERIINEYRGLNLSQPPRLTWVSSAEEALAKLDEKPFDLVITMLCLADADAYTLAERIKEKRPDLPVVLLSHQLSGSQPVCAPGTPRVIDGTFVWTGNADLLLALIKSTEDRLNAQWDTELAGVRVILFVEDSPLYRSSLLPVLYKAVVSQIQAVIEEGLNEKHRLLTMRARPKILVAATLEEATALYERFKPYVLGVVSDVRFPQGGELDENAGIRLLSSIKAERKDIPLLLTSSEPANAAKAATIPAFFLDKNSSSLHEQVQTFLRDHLGFGDFVFRDGEGREIDRADSLRSFEQILASIPAESFYYHWSRNDFSRWLFARTEIIAASRFRPATDADFSGDVEAMREFILSNLRARRRRRQMGVVASFDVHNFDPETDFLKIGKGSLGGKARGLVFIANLLRLNPKLAERYPGIDIGFPRSLVVTTEGFDSFLDVNGLHGMSEVESSDEEMAERFLNTRMPVWITDKLRHYLRQVHYPLAVRSSSLLEDSQTRPYAGLYRTYMLPNDDPDLDVRLQQLLTAIKLVYASTYFNDPKSFARSTLRHFQEEKMAVIIQRLMGSCYGGRHFYPAISGIAQSHNYYPFPPMKMEDGIAHVALGLGKTVVEGGRVLRFCPRHPEVMPQFHQVEDLLRNTQTTFYDLKMGGSKVRLNINEDSTLAKRHIMDAVDEGPLELLADTYVAAEQRIREGAMQQGSKVLTFSQILKYRSIPLAEVLADVLELGRQGMGCPVEIEFTVNLCPNGGDCKPEFDLVQIRPMAGAEQIQQVHITEEDLAGAFCHSSLALGNGIKRDLRDIVYVKPDVFDVAKTQQIAFEIGRLNAELDRQGRRYLLVGPGRWGSADRWLGIPVDWSDISAVGAIVETASDEIQVEPSQGSHFFHNITSLHIDYIMVTRKDGDYLDWNWLRSQPVVAETEHAAHVRLDEPFAVKVEGSRMRCVVTRTLEGDVFQGGSGPDVMDRRFA